MSFGIGQFIPLLLISGGFPIPLIAALILFFKKKRQKKLIFKNELKKFIWVNYSLDGRVKREDYWYYGYALFWTTAFVFYLITAIFYFIASYIFDQFVNDAHIIFLIITLIPIWISFGMKFLSNKIKRLHDNNKSGWFLLWTLVPILGQLFALYIFITNWFFRGTIGYNHYGKDPVKEDIVPVVTIKDAGRTFGLLLVVAAFFAGYSWVYLILTKGI